MLTIHPIVYVVLDLFFREETFLDGKLCCVNSEKLENVNEKINAFEKKTSVSVTKTTRMTNANEAVRVDKKVWSSSYSVNNNNVSDGNGMPRTDPEVRAKVV